jgi:hypothetical protein
MGSTCSSYGRGEKCICMKFLFKNSKAGSHFEDIGYVMTLLVTLTT